MATSSIKKIVFPTVPTFSQKTFKYTYSVQGNKAVTITKSQLNYSVPSGYNYAGIMSITTGAAAIGIVAIRPDNANIITFRNMTSDNQTDKEMILIVLFVSTAVTNIP